MAKIDPNFDLVQAVIESAEKGNPQAQYQLGKMYASGDLVEMSYMEAVRWVGEAAEQGLHDAFPMMAWFYSNGFGVDQDDLKSAAWTRKGAEAGIAKAQYTLACMYRLGGAGCEQDAKQMLHWYHESAQQQYGPALHALGKVMATGELVAEDKIGAYQWLSLAIISGSEKAKESLKSLSSRMSKQERETAQSILAQAAPHLENIQQTEH